MEQTQKTFITFNLIAACNSSFNEFIEENIYQFFDLIGSNPSNITTKNAFLLKKNPEIKMGNHQIYYPNIKLEDCLVASNLGISLVHLSYRSKKQIKKKIINGGKALQETNLPNGLGNHWRTQYNNFLIDGDNVVDNIWQNYQNEIKRDATSLQKYNFQKINF